MSYPYQLHTLIVEDELSVREGYAGYFDSIEDDSVVSPTFAVSFDDACAKLDQSQCYHLIIIDLGLPHRNRQKAQDGIEPGLELIRLAANREAYPVPGVLVISGRLGLSSNVSGLNDQLQKGFWHGCMANKGLDAMDKIAEAIGSVHKYCGIGIHLQDGGSKWYPTLSPREEDMLRRCALATDAVGVDLQWWQAERGTSVVDADSSTGPTKVLAGRFILNQGQGYSRFTFFKFEPLGNAQYVFPNADLMGKKLQHVKVCYKATAGTRALLVTESVSMGEPIAMSEFLCGDTKVITPLIPGVVADICSQLAQIGSTEEDQISLPKLLWPYLARDQIAEAWSAHADNDLKASADPSPLAVFDALSRSTRIMWIIRNSCTHGDLNASNIAIDMLEHGARAFIFDPGCMMKDVGARDLAYLEVTSLLFANPPPGECLVDQCRMLYEGSIVAPVNAVHSDGSALAQNTWRLIAEIRNVAVGQCDAGVYALLVFSAALCQLSGLAVAPMGNKITNPASAARLAAVVARWVSNIIPEAAASCNDDSGPQCE